MTKTCATCAKFQPGRRISSLIREGGLCQLTTKPARICESCWGWKRCSPEQEEERRKAGLI